jgi:hypothetical protein
MFKGLIYFAIYMFGVMILNRFNGGVNDTLWQPWTILIILLTNILIYVRYIGFRPLAEATNYMIEKAGNASVVLSTIVPVLISGTHVDTFIQSGMEKNSFLLAFIVTAPLLGIGIKYFIFVPQNIETVEPLKTVK